MPLLPLQILSLNLVTDTVPALALAVEPGDVDAMQRSPRNPKAAILSPAFLIEVAITHHVLSPSAALANRFALGAVVLSVLLQLAAIYVEPVALALRVVPLGPVEWVVVLACSAVPAVIGQAGRLRGRR